MLVFVQPFGLNSQTGGPRIFRSLLQDANRPFLSVCTSPSKPPLTKVGKEIHLPTRAAFGRLESTRIGPYFYIIESLLARQFERRLEALCLQYKTQGIHGLAHTLDFWYAYQVARKLGVPYYLSVHDDLGYALQKRLEFKDGMARIAQVWANAKARFVISEAMGKEYSHRYGTQPYVIVTDGLKEVPPKPLIRPSKSLRLYFMGAIHLSYQDNFHALLQALKQFRLANPDWDVSLTIRGNVPFSLNANTVPIKILPWASESEVAQDIHQADVLYLPLPFGEDCTSFVKYSLSTKMVTYLGSGLPILYHGPKIAAASQLLSQNGAAIVAVSLDPGAICATLQVTQEKVPQMVESALQVSRSQFLLPDVRDRFWKELAY